MHMCTCTNTCIYTTQVCVYVCVWELLLGLRITPNSVVANFRLLA